ncbi:hypothetical protein PV08_11468 [Exophiala spinifera]|uniref:Short-chain dehydrogenase n=1 Tax=Exophiala spinifera TaxID=91928 RepID=A0A0D2BGS6_9EURO|nr:uncharacterized protein PV08_11468 [Exophiala spinifera]KIW10504.1 hypothetical protein PV08_11468 [Exophiala spinifera]
MSSTPVLLLLGAGSNLGSSIAAAFSQAGYKVALVARSIEPGLRESGRYHIRADLSNGECIPRIFDEVTNTVGTPSVVVYNGKFSSSPPGLSPVQPLQALAIPVQYKLDNESDPFATLAPETVHQFRTTMAVNGTTPLIAVHHAIQAFRKLPPAATGAKGGTFIFTGNVLNRVAVPDRFSFGCAKATCAYGIKMASVVYAGEGIRFYYADERNSEGLPVMRDIDGPAAGRVYLALAEDPKQRAWNYTYTKDGGYEDFDAGGCGEYLSVRQARTVESTKGGRD